MHSRTVIGGWWQVATKRTRLAENKSFPTPFTAWGASSDFLTRITALVFLLAALATLSSPTLYAQSDAGSISGTIVDAKGGLVPDAQVSITNTDTNATFDIKTNEAGVYNAPFLKPGHYRIVVTKQGFKQIDVRDITLNVQDSVNRNFTLDVGATSETVQVNGDSINVNTESAAVGTVIDRDFVANIPLNGRSLQSLISATPGVEVVVNTEGSGARGEFSVNGQRPEANYFMVDGVSANTGSSPAFTNAAGSSGSVPAESALGTTQSMISLDALQEFRSNTSTYSAEYGRTPGGQFSFVSRSGTNDWHGTAFDYFRNEALDANSWFNDAEGIGKTPERQNDFGGTLGGPFRIPGLYNGKDKTFFFFSYEGLRLQQPAGATTDQYPDMTLRQSAPGAIQPFLNAFPVPNGPEVLGTNGQPIGLAYFTAAYSNPSSLDAISIRIDHNLTQSMKIFGRYSESPSSSSSRGAGSDLASLQTSSINVKALTLGATNALTPGLNNDFRFNYTRNNQAFDLGIDNFGGAQPLDVSLVPGFAAPSAPKFYQLSFFLEFGGSPHYNVGPQQYSQQQWNVTDSILISHGSHTLKFGIDYRRLSTYQHNRQLGDQVAFSSESAVVQGTGLAYLYTDASVPPEPLYTNFSAYAQDDWRTTEKLSVSIGLRWDVNPPPGNGDGILPYTLNQITDLNTAQLAPTGTPLWATDYHAFAPRLGMAYSLRQSPGSETVVRGGFGIFYDMGTAGTSNGFLGLGFASSSPVYRNVPLPATAAQVAAIPAPSITSPYNNTVFAFDPNLRLPYALEWNVAVEQALGHSQALTLTYVGSGGRHLLFTGLFYPSANPSFASSHGLYLTKGIATSDYNALQVQFVKKLSHGLQSLVSYTWSHSIDDDSSNFITGGLARGDSDFDVRHNFQAALTYEIPGDYSNPVLSTALRHWGIDMRISALSSFPVDVYNNVLSPNGQFIANRPNLVSGVPIYLFGAQYPGGKILNFNAFQSVATGAVGDLPRNYARAFPLAQADMALRREFPIGERFRLQFRAEAFNIFNHPNFSNIDHSLGDGPYNTATHSGFGGAQSSPNTSLGGLSPLYQVGGQRSLQLALKLLF